MSNRRLESIKPVLDAKLAEDTKEVVPDGNPTYLRLIPEQKHSRGNHSKELADRVWTTTQTVENAFSYRSAASGAGAGVRRACEHERRGRADERRSGVRVVGGRAAGGRRERERARRHTPYRISVAGPEMTSCLPIQDSP